MCRVQAVNFRCVCAWPRACFSFRAAAATRSDLVKSGRAASWKIKRSQPEWQRRKLYDICLRRGFPLLSYTCMRWQIDGVPTKWNVFLPASLHADWDLIHDTGLLACSVVMSNDTPLLCAVITTESFISRNLLAPGHTCDLNYGRGNLYHDCKYANLHRSAVSEVPHQIHRTRYCLKPIINYYTVTLLSNLFLRI